jgi:hypothetical protein
MLLYEVVVGPKRGNKEEDKASAEKDHEWANYEEKQRSPEQTSPIPALSPIEIGARECAEDVWRINQYCPECNHRNERYYSADVKNEKRVTGSYGSDEPDQIVSRTNNPAERDRRGACLSDYLTSGCHWSKASSPPRDGTVDDLPRPMFRHLMSSEMFN